MSDPSSLSASIAGAPAAAPVQSLDNAEIVFNMLQWFGTVVVDCRAVVPKGGARLRESMVCVDAAAVDKLTFAGKDDAICIGATLEVTTAVTSRVRRSVHELSERALQAHRIGR